MEYLVRVDYPQYQTTRVTEKELPAAYGRLTEISSANVTWNDGGDDVLIVAVGDQHCVIALKSEKTWYWLSVSDDDEHIYIAWGGVDGEVPRKALAPRELGLTVLLRADDLPGLRTDYMWTEHGSAREDHRSTRH
jgi:hypothetical protein